jgi:hypothetical protein
VLYVAATAVSLGIVVLLAAGAAIALRRGADVGLLIAAVLYVPVTISPFLTNARYALSGQPFVFGFVAIALVAGYDAARARTQTRTPTENGVDGGSGKQRRNEVTETNGGGRFGGRPAQQADQRGKITP